MKRKSQTRKRSKNLGVIPLESKPTTKARLEVRYYRVKDSQRWLKVEFNPQTGKIRSPYGIWQLPAKGSKLVKAKPSSSQSTGSNQAPIKASKGLEIPKPKVETNKPSMKELLEQKALERRLKEIEKHNLYLNRKYGR